MGKLRELIRREAHESADDSTVYHCFTGDTRYVTADGIKSLAETVGTVQTVLTADRGSRQGRWVEAMIHPFGRQPVLDINLRRNKRSKTLRATSEHRWLVRGRIRTTAELRPGDRLDAALPPSAAPDGLLHSAIRHGVVYGDGTANNGYCNVRLWGEKDKQLVKFFETADKPTFAPVMTPNGVAGVRVSAVMPASYKALPDTDDPEYLLGFLAGYFAADGTVSKSGQVLLHSARFETLEAVQEIAMKLGIATYQIVTKVRQGYGDGPTPLHSIEFVASTIPGQFFLIREQRERFEFRTARYERLGWSVVSVVDRGEVEEVYCPRVADGTESFVLEDWLHTGNCPFCGSGKVYGRSDATVVCEYCTKTFKVKVAPNDPFMPQTDPLTGEPIEQRPIGEAPGGVDPMAAAPEIAATPAVIVPDPTAVPGAAPPPVVARYITPQGAAVDEDAFIRSLAIQHADDRAAVLAEVRSTR